MDQDKNIENAILKLDKSYYNGVDIAIFDPILKPVIEKEVIQMKLDSAASIKLVSEGAAGKRIFEHCLNFYKSRRLDSLTKMEKPKWSQIQNIEEEISKVIPSY